MGEGKLMFKENLSGTGKHIMTITIETDHLAVMEKALTLMKVMSEYAEAIKAPTEYTYSTTRREAAPAPVKKQRQPRKPRVQAVEQPPPIADEKQPIIADQPAAPARKPYRKPTLTPISARRFWAARALTVADAMPGAVPSFLRARFESIAGGVS